MPPERPLSGSTFAHVQLLETAMPKTGILEAFIFLPASHKTVAPFCASSSFAICLAFPSIWKRGRGRDSRAPAFSTDVRSPSKLGWLALHPLAWVIVGGMGGAGGSPETPGGRHILASSVLLPADLPGPSPCRSSESRHMSVATPREPHPKLEL